MEKEKNSGKNIVIAVLIVLLFGLSAFLVYDKLLKKDNNNSTNTTVDNNQNSNNNVIKDNTYYDLTNISCYYNSSSETYGSDCDKYNPKSLYNKYNLPSTHIINKLIVANDKVVYLIMSNENDYTNEKYHEYLYSIQDNESKFINDSYKRIAGVYNVNNEPKVLLYNEAVYGEKFNFKTINLDDNTISTETIFDEKIYSNVYGFTNPFVDSKNNKNYIVLTLASEFTDQLILTTDFNKIDIGLAYHPYDLMDDGNIKIYVDGHIYRIYDDKGNKISEGQY